MKTWKQLSMKKWKNGCLIILYLFCLWGCQALTKDYKKLGDHPDDSASDTGTGDEVTVDLGVTKDSSGSEDEVVDGTAHAQDTGSDSPGETDTSTSTSKPHDSETIDTTVVTGGTITAITSGGGMVQSSGYKLKITLGETAPTGETQSKNFKVKLGVGPHVR